MSDAASLSVVDPFPRAIDRVKKVLFRPFSFRMWFSLGFCAWLAQLGEGGGANFNFNMPSGGGGKGGIGEAFKDLRNWVQANFELVVILAAVAFLFLTVLGLLILWLGSRGKFMFLDGVVRNRGLVVDPWKRYRSQGNSLFLFRLAFGFASFFAFALVAGICVLMALPDIRAEEFGGGAIAAIAVGIVGMILLTVTVVIITLFLDHFVVPIMYLRQMRVMQAWGVFREEMLSDHVGTFTLYILFWIVLAMGIAIIAGCVTCLTCCIAALPYVGTVILLPLHVFVRSYSLYFIEQFGPKWQVFPQEAAD